MREELERFDHVLPLTPGFKLVDKISERLPLPANRTPLVIADCSNGSFKAVEVRWVQGEHFDIIRNVIQLQRFIAAWDGGIRHRWHCTRHRKKRAQRPDNGCKS